VRPRDPRRVIGRRREARARVKIIDVPASEAPPDGSVTTKQEAEVTLPRSELDRIWSPEYLERLARTYWRFLTRFFFGLLRVNYREDGRDITVLGIPFLTLLTFHKPEYEAEADCGSVTWRIKRGFLVAPAGRSNGYLQLVVKRPPADGEEHPGSELVTGTVTSEVANFYPLIAGWGWFSRIGQHLYRITQLKIHVIVTNAFLRSLARLDLAPSVVGALRNQAAEEVEQPEDEPANAA
jgi:hypothetical protein